MPETTRRFVISHLQRQMGNILRSEPAWMWIWCVDVLPEELGALAEIVQLGESGSIDKLMGQEIGPADSFTYNGHLIPPITFKEFEDRMRILKE